MKNLSAESNMEGDEKRKNPYMPFVGLFFCLKGPYNNNFKRM